MTSVMERAAKSMKRLEDTLTQRGAQYGPWERQGYIAQRIKQAFRDGTNWGELAPYQAEALEMIANKISRILNGNPNYRDNWHDIRGYSQLVEDILGEAAEKAERGTERTGAP